MRDSALLPVRFRSLWFIGGCAGVSRSALCLSEKDAGRGSREMGRMHDLNLPTMWMVRCRHRTLFATLF